MPMYEYLCEECGHQFMLLQSVQVRPGETACPQCGADKNRRLFSSFATKGEIGNGLSPSPGGGGCGAGACGCH